MGYFKELPDLEYQSPLASRVSSDEYVRVKNLFRRSKLRDDISNVTTLFEKYQIPDGSRPDLVAEEFYGNAEYDWVVLISAGITNIKDQWPLSDRNLYTFCENKYGEKLNDVRIYETTEVKDSNGRLRLPAGLVVDSTFTIPNPQSPTQTLNPVVSISNYEYEVRKNNEKRGIYILKQIYLQQFLDDMRSIMYYDESSQFVDRTLIRTENTRNTIL